MRFDGKTSPFAAQGFKQPPMPSAAADGINILPRPLPTATAAIAAGLIAEPVCAANRFAKQKQRL